MPKKRHPRRKAPSTYTPKHQVRPKNVRIDDSRENELLSLLYGLQEPISIHEITKMMTGGRSVSKELKLITERLLHAKILRRIGKKHFELTSYAPLYEGTLEQNPRGFGFVSVLQRHGTAPDLTRDAYVSAARMGSAMHGDRVLIRVLKVSGSGRPESVVLKIIERGSTTLAGIFFKDTRGEYVSPEDTRFPYIIKVDSSQYPDLENGNAVIVKIKPPKEPTRTLTGTITEILGPPDSIDVQMRLVIEKFKLPHIFNQDALEEAAALPEEIVADSAREDLRHIDHVTIDGETAKDFDDAVAVHKTETGYRLYVSIADVSHFVQPGSALDADAYQRGTSIYFPGRVIPMLPEKLSNNLCSLLPNTDRLAVTATLDFDLSGQLIHRHFSRSLICSKQRFTYTTVRQILIDQNPEALQQHAHFLPMLTDAASLARLLLKKRQDRGSIGFSLPEAEISLDTDGRISTIARAERNFAHQIIEEFMLAANEAVALTFTQHKRQSLYRIHEPPDPEKVEEFGTFAKTLDLQLPPTENQPEWFAQVLTLCQGSPKEYIVNNLLLRTMQQARYSPKNVGHFGLAATDYTHFTSPIRRYPDLMVHRELCRMIEQTVAAPSAMPGGQTLKENGEFLSGRERTAVGAEREMTNRLKLIFMEKHIGESFDAIISGVSNFAFFVELLELFISGSVALDQLTDDYYLFDEKHYRLIGEVSGNRFQLGDLIRVTLIDVDKNNNRINFKPSSLE